MISRGGPCPEIGWLEHDGLAVVVSFHAISNIYMLLYEYVFVSSFSAARIEMNNNKPFARVRYNTHAINRDTPTILRFYTSRVVRETALKDMKIIPVRHAGVVTTPESRYTP